MANGLDTSTIMSGLNFFALSGGMFFLALVLAIWTVFWAAVALWRAANQKHKLWFFALLLFLLFLPLLGIPSLIYIFVVEKMEMGEWFY